MEEDDVVFPQELQVSFSQNPDDPEDIDLVYHTNDEEHLDLLLSEFLVAMHKKRGAAFVEAIFAHYLHRIGYSGGELPSQQQRDLQA